MKKLLLSVSMFAFALGVNAQTYLFETFDSEGAGWTTIDADNDGHNWEFFDLETAQGVVAVSHSFHNNYGPLTPDNYLISDAIELGTTNLELTYKVAGLDPNYSNEHYAVYVTTSNDVTSISSSVPVYEETLPNGSAAFHSRSVDLSSFTGETVYITFRHYNVTDVYWLLLDDIIVGEAPANEVALIAVDIPAGALAGNIDVKGTVKNFGTNPINELTVSYDAGTGVVTETITGLNIAAGGTYTFTHPTPLAVAIGNSYSVEVCATAPNDAIEANNCKTGSIDFVVSASVTKYVVAEEKTGTWCGWCPRGTVAMDKLSENDTLAITIAVHNSDPMAFSAYDNGTNNLPGFSGFPHAAVDRVIGLDPGDVQQGVNQRKSRPAPATITFNEAVLNGNTITVTPSVNMVTSLNGDYGLAVVLVEDSVVGSGNGWLQVNYYAGGSYGPLVATNGTNWATLPQQANQVEEFGGYHHVGRALGANNINGEPGALPTTLNDGESYTHTYTFTKNADWKPHHMSAVAMLIKKSTGEILNAGKTPLTGWLGLNDITANDFRLEVFPNPSQGNTNIRINLESASEVSFTVYNMVGEMVHSISPENLSNGAHVYAMDLSNMPSGMYLAHVSVDGTTKIVKLNVVK